jgi:mono/diheme cytochrome c family protein
MRAVFGLLAVAAVIAGESYAAQKLGEAQSERAPETLYAKTCGYCHGKNVGPVIRGRALPVATIKSIVRRGQHGMPAFRPTEITNAELDALAAWIAKSKADPKELGY